MGTVRRILPVLLFLAACRDSAYQAASKADTVQAYRSFVERHPKDDNLESAKSRLAELEFAEAQRVHSVVAYKRFIDEFPDADKVPAARALLEGLRFNAARGKGTAAALRIFLREHPDGAHREEAEQLLSAVEIKEITGTSDRAELTRFVSEHPDDPRAPQATVKIDDGVWAEASGAAALYAYLREFPSGAHRDEARVKLLSRQLDGLVMSGLLDEAKALAVRSPLAAQLKDLPKRWARAEAWQALAGSSDERVRRAQASWYLRSREDLVKALSAPDAMDRWDAAEELGQVVSVKVFDPLLEALRVSRSPLVRQRAFESLGRVLRALPGDVADYEVATRLETLREEASDAQLHLTTALLLDLSGQLSRAASEYQRAWDPGNPDPVVLRRWAEIRRERRQFFSAAVAARQLAIWAAGLAGRAGPVGPASALAVSREACAAVDAARFSAEVLREARGQKTEFPEDVEAFTIRAEDALKLAEAKLRDAELVLLQEDSRARKCGDTSLRRRLDEAEVARLQVLGELRAKPPRELPALLELARERDPSPKVRASAHP